MDSLMHYTRNRDINALRDAVDIVTIQAYDYNEDNLDIDSEDQPLDYALAEIFGYLWQVCVAKDQRYTIVDEVIDVGTEGVHTLVRVVSEVRIEGASFNRGVSFTYHINNEEHK